MLAQLGIAFVLSKALKKFVPVSSRLQFGCYTLQFIEDKLRCGQPADECPLRSRKRTCDRRADWSLKCQQRTIIQWLMPM